MNCKTNNCPKEGNYIVFNHCIRCWPNFCCQFCDFGESIIKLLNKWKDNFWLCPNCSKLAVNAVFVEKDIEEHCLFLFVFCFDAMEKQIAKIEEHNAAMFNSLERIKKNAEDNNTSLLKY